MSKKFTLLLLGPAGSGKSAFVAGLSKFNIFNYVTAKKQGGANTTKVATTYEFSNKCERFEVIDCVAADNENKKDILEELQKISRDSDGIEKIFYKINDTEFSKKCKGITVQLPCKDNLIPTSSLFDTIVVRDSRGFGDVDDDKEIKVKDLGITYDVNAILFMSVTSNEPPAIFAKIIEDVMKFNLKTPMFLLRRDTDLTQNDVEFEETIINNISSVDEQLSNVIKNMDRAEKGNRINSLVFNLPEVKLWKGAVKISEEQTQYEIGNYSEALKEILHYSIEMYEQLYKVIVEKLQGEYQELFVKEILNELISEKAFTVAAQITSDPTVTPSDNYSINRDTAALASPVKYWHSEAIPTNCYPFFDEASARGPKPIIPSYSYSCVNFRNIFRRVVSHLISSSNYRLISLFNTFMDIVLEDSTVTTRTGYTFRSCERDAFKFDIFIEARNKCTDILAKPDLVEEDGTWKTFPYNPLDTRYYDEEAIAVFMYKTLIESLNLSETYKKYVQKSTHESTSFVEARETDRIIENFVK